MSQEDKEQLYELGDKLYGIGKDTIDALASEEALEKYQKIFSQLSETTAAALTNTVSTGAVGKFNAMVEAYEGKVSVAEPTDEDLKGYNDILAAYEKLTDEQKGQVDLFMFDKMFHLILDREKQVSIKNNPDISSNKQHTVNAQLAAEEILGNVGYAAAFAGAKELATVMSDSKKTIDEKMEAYMSSHEYTLYVDEINAKDSNMVMDARIRPILVPIFNLIDQFVENPLDTLLTVLPKLGYALKTDLINTQIATLLGKMSLVSIDPPDLSAGGLFDMLAPMLQNLDLNGTSISITLNKDNFLKFVDDIGGCGNAIWKNSKIRGKAYSLGVDPDKSDAFLVMFRWLYGELTSAQNSQAIQTAIDSSTLGTVPKSLIKSAWNSISKLPADTAIAVLINLTAPALPGFDNVPGSNLPNTDSSNGSNAEAEKNSNSAKPDNPSIPKTGGGAAVSLFVLAATAGIAAGAVLLKKKTDSDQD